MSLALDRLLQKQRLAELSLAQQLAENDRDVALVTQLAQTLPALAKVGVDTVDHVQTRTREDALERAMAELASTPDALAEKNALTGVADGPLINRPFPNGESMEQVIAKRKIAEGKAVGPQPEKPKPLASVDVARVLAGAPAAPAAPAAPEARVEEILKVPEPPAANPISSPSLGGEIVAAPAPKGLAADLAGVTGNVQPPLPHFKLQGELPAFKLPEKKAPALNVPALERPAAPPAPAEPPEPGLLKTLREQYGSGKKGPVGPGGIGGSDPFAILPDESAKQWRQRLRNMGKSDAEINKLVPKYWGMGEKLEFDGGEEKRPEGSVGASRELALMLAGAPQEASGKIQEASAQPVESLSGISNAELMEEMLEYAQSGKQPPPAILAEVKKRGLLSGSAGRARTAPPVAPQSDAPQDASRANPVVPPAPPKPKPKAPGMGNGNTLPPVMPATPAPRDVPPMMREAPSLSPGKLQLDPLLMALAGGERPLPLPEEVKANPILYKAPPKSPAPEAPAPAGPPTNPLDRGLPKGIADVDVAKLLAGGGAKPNYRSSMNELVDGAMHRAGLENLSDYERQQIRAKLMIEASKLRKEHEKSSAGADLDKLKKLAEVANLESQIGAREVAELEKQSKGYQARADYEKAALADRMGASDVLSVLEKAAEPDANGILRVNPDRLSTASQDVAKEIVSTVHGNRLIDATVVGKLLENQVRDVFKEERDYEFEVAVQKWRENSADLDRSLKQSIAGMRVGSGSGRGGKRRAVPPSTIDSLSAAREELITSSEMVDFFEKNRPSIMADMSGARSSLKVFFDEVGRELPSIGIVLPSKEGGFGAGGQIDLGKLSQSISKALALVNSPQTKRFLGLYGQKVFASANRLNGGRMTDADYAILSGFLSPNSSDARVFIPSINDIVVREQRQYRNRYESLSDLYDVSDSLSAPVGTETIRSYEEVEKPIEEAAADKARRQSLPYKERFKAVEEKLSPEDRAAIDNFYNRGMLQQAIEILSKYE